VDGVKTFEVKNFTNRRILICTISLLSQRCLQLAIII
jgi:hypothetical protein